jgi:hypothetical protein
VNSLRAGSPRQGKWQTRVLLALNFALHARIFAPRDGSPGTRRGAAAFLCCSGHHQA